MLAALKADLAIHLRSLKSLQLAHLQRVQLLVGIHLRLDKGHLTLRQLDQLWLPAVLEVADRVDRLVHRGPVAVTRLEATLLLALEVAHLTLLFLLGLLWGLVPPVALEVSGRVPIVSSRASSSLEIVALSLGACICA